MNSPAQVRFPEEPHQAAICFWFAASLHDLRLGLRALRRARGFSLAVIITLALCIGANTAILSVLHGLLLKPLPFPEPERLVEIHNTYAATGEARRRMSVAQYLDYRDHAHLFSGFAIWGVWSMTFGEDSNPAREIGARVSHEFFPLLGVQPLHGRFFTAEDCTPGADRVAVLTQTFWENYFRADPSIIGRTVQITGEPFTIVGIAPRAIEQFNADAHLFRPYAWPPQLAGPETRHEITVGPRLFARLKPGTSPDAGLAQLTALEQRFQETASPALREFVEQSRHRVGLAEVRVAQTAAVRTPLYLLQGGVLFVLLIGCVNIANLMLARASVRQTELAVCQALGASRAALARRLLIEAALLTVAGAALGMALATAGLRVINSYLATIVREAPPVALDGTVLALTLGVATAVALLIGLLPAWRLARGNLLELIQAGGRSLSPGRMRAARAVLVTSQVAIALILLAGTGLLLRSFARVLAVTPGFDATIVIHGRFALPRAYNTSEKNVGAQQQVLARMREIPGIESVALSSHLPVAGQFLLNGYVARDAASGAATGNADARPSATILGISPGFFATMGIRLIDGRDFADSDTTTSRSVYIIDRALAERLFPGRSAVGQALALRAPPPAGTDWPVIVGVVENARFHGPESRDGLPFVFTPLTQTRFPGYSLLLRTSRALPDVLPLVRQKLREVDPTLPLYATSTLQGDIDGLLRNRRGVVLLSGAFALLALVLAALGLYGMLAYDVTQRTREIGIRGALGATRAQLVLSVLGQGLRQTLLGLGIGLIVTFWLMRFVRALLFEIEPTDPATLAGMSLLLLLIAALACWLPARRAAKINPIEALRAD